MADIVVHPIFDAHYRQIQAIRKRIVQTLAQREELVSVICPNLSMEYYIHLEPEDTKLFQLQLQFKRLKREISLIQWYINQQLPIDMEEIQRQLDLEYQEYDDMVRRRFEERQKAFNRKKRMFQLSDKDQKRLQDAYRKIVPKLHPDLNPNATSAQIKLFIKANEALKTGDIGLMYDILLQVQEMNLVEYTPPQTIPQLKEEIIRYAKQYNALIREIIKIKNDFPYNMIRTLSSKEGIENHLLHVQSEMQKIKVNIAHYNELKEALLAENE
ncbi:MAG: hypothetical protein IKW80_11630 [Thermoguttaceae bacterium]|nr:hypothetical protein [Thermoguttaceae bacterium]